MLCRHLGLRAEETVQACQSLSTWSKQLAQGKDTIRIIFGTKGNRPRNLTILDGKRAGITEAVKFAAAVAKNQGGHLIEKPNLKEAMDHFHNEARALGLIEKNSPHSLRYLFAHEQFHQYELAGYTRKEGLAQVALDLGHGDGRGRYVERVYLL